MSAKESRRKCFKCGKSPASDNIKLFRFPKPAVRNLLRARAWAVYCWPDKDWSSTESLYSLYVTNKVLCGRHFDSSQFYDSGRQKLSKFAVPHSTEVEELLANRENVFNENYAKQPSEMKLQESQVPFFQKENEDNQVKIEDALIQMPGTSKSNSDEHNGLQRSPGPSIPKRQRLDNIEDLESDLNQLENNESVLNLPECETIADDDFENDDGDDIECLGENKIQLDPDLSDFACNVCEGDIFGFRYACVQCEDFDMCAACEGRGAHSHHYVLRIPAPKTYMDSHQIVSAVREFIKYRFNTKNEIQEVYFKEEDTNDEMKEHVSRDLVDPLPVGCDRDVPEIIPQENITNPLPMYSEQLYTDSAVSEPLKSGLPSAEIYQNEELLSVESKSDSYNCMLQKQLKTVTVQNPRHVAQIDKSKASKNNSVQNLAFTMQKPSVNSNIKYIPQHSVSLNNCILKKEVLKTVTVKNPTCIARIENSESLINYSAQNSVLNMQNPSVKSNCKYVPQYIVFKNGNIRKVTTKEPVNELIIETNTEQTETELVVPPSTKQYRKKDL